MWISFFEEKGVPHIVWYGESEAEVLLAQKIFKSKRLRAVQAADSLVEKLTHNIYNGWFYNPKKLDWKIVDGIAL